MIDPSWIGPVQFFELFFGTWLVYAFLVVMWEFGLKVRLAEWRYVMLTYLGASFFLVNRYLYGAPWYMKALIGYSIIYLAVYWWMAIRGQARGAVWKTMATLSAVVFTIAYILFETIARKLHAAGVQEFWIMVMGHFGFIAVIAWRGAALRKR